MCNQSSPEVRRIVLSTVTTVLLAGLLVLPAAGETGRLEREPAQELPFERIRQEEDWINLPDPSTDGLPRWKRIALGDRWFLSLGADWRLAYEINDNEEWGHFEGTDLMALHGAMVHADLRRTLGSGLFAEVRLFTQLKHGETAGREFEDRVPDVDRLDLNAGFVELTTRELAGTRWSLRLGRQELSYGEGRLVSPRAGATNTRISFDAATLRASSELWQAEFFYAFPNETDPGVFDNDRLEGRKLRGLYVTRRLSGRDGGGGAGGLDTFWMHDERPQTYFQAEGRESRHTVGVRPFWRSDRWRHDVLMAWQWGELERSATSPAGAGVSNIEGWTASTDSHFLLSRRHPWEPELNLFTGWATGNDDPTGQQIGAFRAPFPPGRYFGAAAPQGPVNLAFYHLGYAIRPRPWLALEWGAYDFYRVEEEDGAYGLPGIPLRGPESFEGRSIGQLYEFLITIPWGSQAQLVTEMSHFVAGDFVPAERRDGGFLGVRIELRY